MTEFKAGDKVVHIWVGDVARAQGKEGARTFVTLLEKSHGDGWYCIPKNTDVFGTPIFRWDGIKCYLLNPKFFHKIEVRTKQEQVLDKIKVLNKRFKDKTIKIKSSPLPLPH